MTNRIFLKMRSGSGNNLIGSIAGVRSIMRGLFAHMLYQGKDRTGYYNVLRDSDKTNNLPFWHKPDYVLIRRGQTDINVSHVRKPARSFFLNEIDSERPSGIQYVFRIRTAIERDFPFKPTPNGGVNIQKEGAKKRGTEVIHMHAAVIVIIVIIAVIVIGFALWFTQKRRSVKIRQRFGPEYDRTLREVGDKRKAESVLEHREKRVARFNIQPLLPADRQRLTQSWREVQAQFVDDPKGAASRADELVTEALRLRGYPVTDFEQRAADLSVDHPIVVENYRAAHEIALRHQRGAASTEDLRQAMVYYRTLFEEVVGSQESVHSEVKP